MGNLITNDRIGDDLDLSNGGTDVFLSVLLLAGSDLAETTWEKQLMTWLAEQDQTLYGRGTVGFDIAEFAWRKDTFEEQKDFVLKMTDRAMRKHRWNALDYDPPFAQENLRKFCELIEAYAIEMIESETDWNWKTEPAEFLKCQRHQVYVHALGCLICHDAGIME